MSLKRYDSVRQGNPNPSVFTEIKIGKKWKKYFSECRKRGAKVNSDCYFLVFILCMCIVLILLKYINIYLVLI